MRPLLQQLTTGNLVHRLDGWMLQALTRPPVTSRTRVLIVTAYVFLIGLVDYLSGAAISLQVFYLVPIALALAWLGFFAAFATSVCSIMARVGGDYLLGAPYTHQPSIVWNTVGFLATYMIMVWVLHAFITLRRELEERVNSRSAALAREIQAREQLQQELMEIGERERRAIGNDLHDGLGQHLTAMAFAAEVLTTQLSNNDKLAAGTAREILRLAEDGIEQSRQLARGLLLSAIEPGDLNRELQELAASVQRQTGVRCHYEDQQPPLAGDTSVASHLFRIAQEAMHTSIKHAQATALNLSLNGGHRSLVLSISDNGAGLSLTSHQEAGANLLKMEHRAKLIGADFTLESKPGQGTRISCRVPLPATSFRATVS